MCRIAGKVGLHLTVSQMVREVEAMCDVQKHGGPDDSGIFIAPCNRVVLGNRRLSFFDLSAEGHMPMTFGNRYTVTYNGEIYNFNELRQELTTLGHHFRSHSDTEVILAAFSQWGSLSFSMFKGMFAFALWDAEEEELFLVRDASGIKPLYYSISKDEICFASEIRAFNILDKKPHLDERWPVYFMAYGHIPEPVTTFENIKPLNKGFFLHYKIKSGKHSLQSFRHYSYCSIHTSASVAQDLIRNKTLESVKRHLLADAPVGVFLSGGLDSGILASVAASVHSQPIDTLSIYFNEPEFSEKKYQDLIIDQLGCKNHQLLLNQEEFENSFFDILDSMDMPSCDGINTWFISKYARMNGLKAVLSGLGGDELFGGYPSFSRMRTSDLLQSMPNVLLTSGKKMNSKRLNRMSYLSMDGMKGIYLFLRGHFTPYEIAKQLGYYEKEVWDILNQSPVVQDVDRLTPGNRAGWMEFNLYMQNQLLRDADVMSMIHGVEIRVPFLDVDLIRAAHSIDPKIKFHGPRPKQFLIDTFKDMIPAEIWNRSKMGFSFPFEQWLRDSKVVRDKVSQSSIATRNNYDRFMKGKLHWSQMMSLIILQHRQVA